MPVEAKPLFRPDALRPHLQGYSWPANVAESKATLAKWGTMLSTGRADKFKEQELLPDFLTDVFCKVLGYVRPADNAARFTISREKHVQVDGKFADAVLGNFRPGSEQFIVALEGKGPLDPLDRPHAGRKMSAVDQAYKYAINLRCDWIIVTSMRQTRLYHKGADQYTYERFDTERLATDESVLKRFLFLLGAERVTPEFGPCHLDALLTTSEKAGKELTKEFYFRYAEMRQNAFEHLCSDNPGIARNELLTATQKLLDRILFCAFCEDRGLLPADTILQAYQHRDLYHQRPIWDTFRGLFRSIDTGNEVLNIPAYNGGLFAYDAGLDDLKVSDGVCDYFRELSAYDYRPASTVSAETEESAGQLVDVDILGHIFEQSITDLERLRNELEGRIEPLTRDKLTSRRKKEGAFYTPAFITRYIVEQALGSVLKDRFESLRVTHEAKAKGSAKTALGDPSVYELNLLKEPQKKALVAFWEAWQDELGRIRVLDPACGSGAFLIEAFDQLHKVYEISNDRLEELRGSRTLFDPDRQILQQNLFGVDLNEEAIEICRLSLWIKTAARGKVLTSLDHTIRVGNSVVTDPAVHPRAFDWQAAFPEVFANGGFDVIVGNPPYIRQEWLAPFKPHWKEAFQSFDGVADIFTYFYELGVNLLRTDGRLGFITSGSWVRGNFGSPLRAFLSKSAAIDSMVDFGEYQPFEDAELIRPTIAIIRKDRPGGAMRLFKWLTSGPPPENLTDIIAAAPTMRTDHLGTDAWELDPDDVLALRQKLSASGIPLSHVVGDFYNGIKTGFDEAFVISATQARELIEADARSQEVLMPVVQGTHMRSWYVEESAQFLIALKSSANHQWPWSSGGVEAETQFAKTYPAVFQHLHAIREKVAKRADQGVYWWELRSCAYWNVFESRSIVWPDITNRPRFSFLEPNITIGMTGFVVRSSDSFLLGVLGSWVTWFFISKTAQPLRLRSGRWQYRLKAQYMEHVPIPDAGSEDREAIGKLADLCSALGLQRHELQTGIGKRLVQSFGQDSSGQPLGSLNNKAQAWWEQSLNDLGDALKTSFKLKANPFKRPQTADEWEPYLAEKRAAVDALTRQLAEAEAEINARVYKLFNLTPEEILLLEREVEH